MFYYPRIKFESYLIISERKNSIRRGIIKFKRRLEEASSYAEKTKGSVVIQCEHELVDDSKY